MNDDDSPQRVRAFIDGALPPEDPPNDAKPVATEAASGNGKPETPKPCGASGLPPDCPITPLGKDHGVRWFLDGNGQLRGIEGARLTRLQILDLLGTAAAYAEKIFGTETRSGTLRFDSARAEQMLLAATAKRIWSPTGRVRGRGFWSYQNGKLIVHAGTCLLIDGECREPGVYGDQVYPAGLELTLPQPLADPRDPFAAGREVLALFERWKWRRAIDPRLALGALASLIAGGALTWRPILAINGATDVGKSLLFAWWEALACGWVIATQDATEAGIRGTLGYDSRGVAVDEAEPGSDGRTERITKMGRRTSGGGRSHRGTPTNQGAIEFNLFCTIALGAIVRSGFAAQDINRRVVLELDELAGPPPLVNDERARRLGPQLLHGLIIGWPRVAPAVAQFQQALQKRGHKGRAALVLGIVLALADILLTHEPVDSDTAEAFTEELTADALPDAKLALSPAQAWLIHFAGFVIPERSGPEIKPQTIAKWITDAVSPFEAVAEHAATVLAQHGIKIMRPKDKSPPKEWWIAARNPNLARLHAATRWRADEEGVGGWIGAAQKLPDAKGWSDRLAGPTQWGARIPLALIIDPATSRPTTRQEALDVVETEEGSPVPIEHNQ